MMPPEQPQAVVAALLDPVVTTEDGRIIPHALVDRVRTWFNDHGVAYSTFSFDDLRPHLPSGARVLGEEYV